jgi:hypothetical protein
MGRDQGNQGRSSNLSEQDRSKGGQTSANEQRRDDQGQFTGTGMGNRQGGMGGEPGSQGTSTQRDDQGQFKSPQGGGQGGSHDQSGSQGRGGSQGRNQGGQNR